MRIAMIGPGGSGKGTASSWLAAHTPLRYCQSTSQAAARIVYADPVMKSRYLCLDACHSDRRRHRDEWRNIILEYNKPSGVRLYEEMAAENDILDGIRCAWELEQCRRHGLVDKAIWIERPGVSRDSSLSIDVGDCDYVVDNSGSRDDLYGRLAEMCMGLDVPWCAGT